ncbi:cytochrome P450 [Xylaria intraflava]|nr:cytochrome P450 [Xylaria intraflava]
MSLVLGFFVYRNWLTSGDGLDTGTSGKVNSVRPPSLPNVIPLLGRIPIGLFWNPSKFYLSNSVFWQRHTIRVKAMFQDIYIIQGARDMRNYFNQRSLSLFFLQPIIMRNVFSLPAATVKAYLSDNSGEGPEPLPGTNVLPHNRVEYLFRQSQRRFLTGPGQTSFFRRFDINAAKRFSNLDFSDEWTHVPDFTAIFKSDLTAAVMDALAGPGLMRRNPSFAEDLWAFNEGVGRLLLGLPRFLSWKSHQARRRVLDAVRDWQAWASKNFTPDSIDEDGNDPFWGCKFFRERQEMFAKVDGFGVDAVASEDLSFLWSSVTNANVSSFWATLEVFRDPALLAEVREEVYECIQSSPESHLSLDVAKLLHQPLLQAIFAENLRLRVHGLLARRPPRDINVNNWTIPRDSLCLASATTAGMDAEFWCSGEMAAFPVDRFYPGRFLRRSTSTDAVEFSLAGKGGYWVPFGGGPHSCPGKAFTKRQNILAVALMVTLYDCEVLGSREDHKQDMGMLPLGVASPKGKIPVRLRRRLPRTVDCVIA